VEALRRRQSTAAFGQRLVERKWKIEGLFGEAKHNQFFMIAIALNCKRVITTSYLARLILVLLCQLSIRQKCSAGELRNQPNLTLTPA
jgi:hypothetical protein